jgi:hypothetical protein
MSSTKLAEISRKLHAGLWSTRRLEKLASTWQPGEEYTFDHLYQEVSPRSPELLSLILTELVKQGFLEKLVRVESPQGGGIGDFPSVADVPDTIYDWRSDREMEVQPQNLRVLFKVSHHGR